MSGSLSRVPLPNSMRGRRAIEKGEESRSCGQESVHRLAAARLGHHAGDGVAPGEVVRGLLVRGGVGGRRVGLVEDEARRVVGCLQDIETPVARLADRRLVIARVAAMKASTSSGLTRTWTSVTCMVASLEFTRGIVHSCRRKNLGSCFLGQA
jgi:hypothetical protein